MNTETPAVETPLMQEPVKEVKPVSQEAPQVEAEETPPPAKEERTWSEEIELAGNQLVDQVKSWIAEGNVRRLILRTPDDSMVLEIPLMAGAVVGGVLTFFAPLLAVLGAIASVLAQVKVEIVRVEEVKPKEE
jgi:hypothetical protein